jgi:hypothetical protein
MATAAMSVGMEDFGLSVGCLHAFWTVERWIAAQVDEPNASNSSLKDGEPNASNSSPKDGDASETDTTTSAGQD